MGTNFESTYPLLKASGYGSIVNISSILSLRALPGVSSYAASKGAVNQLTKNLASEWAKDNIRLNAVAPGTVMTTLLEFIMNEPGGKDGIDILRSRTPMGRLGELKEISALVAFLCLPAASYITGQIIYADGGFTA